MAIQEKPRTTELYEKLEQNPEFVADFKRLWDQMPLDARCHAVDMLGARVFDHMPMRVKIQMLECGGSWTELVLEEREKRRNRAQEQEWLTKAKKELGKLRKFLKQPRAAM